MPLAVTLLSAAEHLDQDCELRVYLVDNGLAETSRAMLRETLADTRVSVEFVPARDVSISDLGISHHISHAAYLRLFADRWLPEGIEKVIYLDSDLIVRESLTKLWDFDLGDNICLAAPDIACPFIDARRGSNNFRKSSPYLASLTPIVNYRELGLRPDAYYFNSGVMVLDVAQWRAGGIGDRLVECLRRNQSYVWCWDQYALNAVLANKWGRLPLRWNAGSHLFEFPSPGHSPIDPQEFEEMLTNPAIIHFTSEFKPWNYENQHPWRAQFFEMLDRTVWKDWRPEKPKFSLAKAWQRQAVHWTKQFTIAYRKLAALGVAN